MKKRYVLGFCFLPDNSCVLINKEKPDWQKGLANGLGGKIEEGESIHEAMAREFYEECGVATHPKHWTHGVTFGNEEWELNVLRCRLNHYPDDYTDTDEGKIFLATEPPLNMEQTALWLYWMCRDDSTFGVLA